MSNKHLKVRYRDSASKLHKALGTILKQHPKLRGFRTCQEYRIPHSRYHIDWFILDLSLAIEVHGEQHYKPVRFGGRSEQEARDAFELQQIADIEKKNYCRLNGWRYLAFRYNEKLDAEYVVKKIFDVLKDSNEPSGASAL